MTEHNVPVPPKRAAWLEAVDRYKSTCADEQEFMLTCEQLPIRPERICGKLSQTMHEDAMVVVDTGQAGMWLSELFDICARTQSYIRSAGHLAFGAESTPSPWSTIITPETGRCQAHASCMTVI